MRIFQREYRRGERESGVGFKDLALAIVGKSEILSTLSRFEILARVDIERVQKTSPKICFIGTIIILSWLFLRSQHRKGSENQAEVTLL